MANESLLSTDWVIGHNLNRQLLCIGWPNYWRFFFHFQVEQSFMTFEGQQLQGSVKIAEKLAVSGSAHPDKLNFPNNFWIFHAFQSLTFKKIDRAITSVDCQPTFDGGVIIHVIGRLRVSEANVHTNIWSDWIWRSLSLYNVCDISIRPHSAVRSNVGTPPDWWRSTARIFTELRFKANRDEFFYSPRYIPAVASRFSVEHAPAPFLPISFIIYRS